MTAPTPSLGLSEENRALADLPPHPACGSRDLYWKASSGRFRCAVCFTDRQDEIDAVLAALTPSKPTLGEGEPEWVPWSGGSIPVHPSVRVEYRLKSGRTNVTEAIRLDWTQWGLDDIVAYRVLPDAPPPTPRNSGVEP